MPIAKLSPPMLQPPWKFTAHTTMARYGAPEDVTALGLAQHIQAVLQGSFILAKTTNDPAIARESVTHLKRYVRMLFEPRGAP